MGHLARNARLLSRAVGAIAAVCLVAAGSGSAAPSTNRALLVEHWDGTAWTGQATPNGESLEGVAALSATNVWAVGRALVHRNLALAVHWDGSSWRQARLPEPRGSAAILWSVAGRPGDLWAVGSREKPGVSPQRPLIEHRAGSAWRIVSSPHPRSTSQLLGVAVLSPSDAWAVGSSGAPNRARMLIEHWDGTRWRIVRSGIGSGDGGLTGVAAVSPRDIWAVGQSGRRRQSRALVVHWNGKGWRRVRGPAPGMASGLSGVTATGRRDLWAVGYYRTSHRELPLAERWDGRSWRAVAAPAADSHSPYQALTAVATGPAGDAWAAGYVLHGPVGDPASFEQTALERWDGTAWTPVTPPEPATRGNAFYGLAVLSSGEAWAVGWTGGPVGTLRLGSPR